MGAGQIPRRLGAVTTESRAPNPPPATTRRTPIEHHPTCMCRLCVIRTGIGQQQHKRRALHDHARRRHPRCMQRCNSPTRRQPAPRRRRPRIRRVLPRGHVHRLGAPAAGGAEGHAGVLQGRAAAARPAVEPAATTAWAQCGHWGRWGPAAAPAFAFAAPAARQPVCCGGTRGTAAQAGGVLRGQARRMEGGAAVSTGYGGAAYHSSF